MKMDALCFSLPAPLSFISPPLCPFFCSAKRQPSSPTIGCRRRERRLNPTQFDANGTGRKSLFAMSVCNVCMFLSLSCTYAAKEARWHTMVGAGDKVHPHPPGAGVHTSSFDFFAGGNLQVQPPKPYCMPPPSAGGSSRLQASTAVVVDRNGDGSPGSGASGTKAFFR